MCIGEASVSDDGKYRIRVVRIIGNSLVNITAVVKSRVCHAHALIKVMKIFHGAIKNVYAENCFDIFKPYSPNQVKRMAKAVDVISSAAALKLYSTEDAQIAILGIGSTLQE